MTMIIAGRFIRQDAAAASMAQLIQSGFDPARMTSFFVNPAGQHDTFPIGGDVDESPGTEMAGAGAATGAVGGSGVGVAVGLATLPILGPGALIAGAAVGAYVGSFVGALDNMQPDEVAGGMTSTIATSMPADSRKSGMLVAVVAVESREQLSAIGVLRGAGATDIERAEGEIRNGEWPGFNPLTPVVSVDA